MWTYRPQNRQVGSAFALAYILRLRSCRLLGAVVMAPLPPMLSEDCRTVGLLCSTGVTPLRCYYQPLRHPLVFDRLPRVAGYTAYLASADFAAGRGGLLQLLGVSLSPCCRSHPAGAREPSQSVFGPPCSLRPSGCGLGLRIFSLSRPPMRSLALRSGDSPASRRCCCRWASEIRFPSSLPSELQGS